MRLPLWAWPSLLCIAVLITWYVYVALSLRRPERIDVEDTAAIRASLDVHGYACIADVADEQELEHGRDLLWDHIEGRTEPKMRQTRPVGWKRGQPETWKEGHGDGLMTSGTHCEAMWYVRTLPGVVRAFEAAYGEPAVCAYDRPSVNLPTSSGNEAALRVAEQWYPHGKLHAGGLHTHFNQVRLLASLQLSSAELTARLPPRTDTARIS